MGNILKNKKKIPHKNEDNFTEEKLPSLYTPINESCSCCSVEITKRDLESIYDIIYPNSEISFEEMNKRLEALKYDVEKAQPNLDGGRIKRKEEVGKLTKPCRY